MDAFTFEQVQTSFQKTIDFVETGKALTITQDVQPTEMLFFFTEGPELLRLRHAARSDGYSAARLENVPQDELRLPMDDINKLVNELRP